VQEVYRIVHDADYLVLGLGDVYVGASVATPLDPRHRLVTTTYSAARMWTPEDAVGIGGGYLCICGMEGPGGYQFAARTVQVWSGAGCGPAFEPGSGWLLRFFDRMRWHPATAEELLELRADMATGRLEFATEDGSLTLAAQLEFREHEADSIAAFRERRALAFAAERAAWAQAGEFARR
jgi:urea carboxylase